MNKARYLCLIILLCITKAIFAVDNPHYFKAPYLNATKSWKDKDWMSIIDMHYANGSTHRARDNNGDSVGTFDLYGNHNLLYITTNVPAASGISSTLQGYIDALEAQRISFENDNPSDKQTFGQVNFSGKCEVDEFMFNYRQNILCGFFAELNIPLRRVSTGPLTLVDQSSTSVTANNPYTQTDTTWVNFVNNLEEILQAYGLTGYRSGSGTTNFGDISLFAGWQKKLHRKRGNDSFFSMFEYINFAIKAGVLFPTGSKRKSTQPFSFETGYNDHWGFPIRGDLVLGLSNDIYIDLYSGAIFFSSRTHNSYPVQTHESQNGFIKLYRTKITEKKGTLFDIGTYLRLDHFFKGLSAVAGYSYNRRASDSLSLVDDCTQTNNTIINKDLRLKSWYQHVLHLLAEYDIGVHDFFKTRKWKPRIGIFYNHPFDGKRTIMNAMVAGTFGCDFTWNL